VTSRLARTALSHRICTGLPRRRLGKLIAELAGPWTAQREGRLHDRRGRGRLRAAGAGPNHDLVFTDRVVATLVILRFQLPHGALAVFYGVDRATITRAVHEIRPLLAARGFAVPGKPELRLRTLADVFAYAAAEGVHLRIDGTEVQVRRPKANRPGRRAFVSGKRRQNTIKPTVISDHKGRTLWAGATRPGRMHDVTALRTEGIEDTRPAVAFPRSGLQVHHPHRLPKDQALGFTDNGHLNHRGVPAAHRAQPDRPHHLPGAPVLLHPARVEVYQLRLRFHHAREPGERAVLHRYGSHTTNSHHSGSRYLVIMSSRIE
jgi:hypothetical protein